MPGLLEPVVGSRTPLPQSQGGPMDREALLRALMLRQQMQQQQQTPNLGLTADPLMNPRAILEARMRAGGV